MTLNTWRSTVVGAEGAHGWSCQSPSLTRIMPSLTWLHYTNRTRAGISKLKKCRCAQHISTHQVSCVFHLSFHCCCSCCHCPVDITAVVVGQTERRRHQAGSCTGLIQALAGGRLEDNKHVLNFIPSNILHIKMCPSFWPSVCMHTWQRRTQARKEPSDVFRCLLLFEFAGSN